MSEDMKAELERLRAENEALKKKKSTSGTLSMKVSEKGALSVYGMGRFPVTLYKEQWLKLLSISDELKVDFESYHVHPNCKTLICFVYDPNGYIFEPDIVSQELSGTRVKNKKRFEVKLFIRS